MYVCMYVTMYVCMSVRRQRHRSSRRRSLASAASSSTTISNAKASVVCLPILSKTHPIPKKKLYVTAGHTVKVTVEVSRDDLLRLPGNGEETKDTGLMLAFPDGFTFQKAIVGPAPTTTKKAIGKPHVLLLEGESTVYWQYAPIPAPGKTRKYTAVFKVGR